MRGKLCIDTLLNLYSVVRPPLLTFRRGGSLICAVRGEWCLNWAVAFAILENNWEKNNEGVRKSGYESGMKHEHGLLPFFLPSKGEVSHHFFCDGTEGSVKATSPSRLFHHDRLLKIVGMTFHPLVPSGHSPSRGGEKSGFYLLCHFPPLIRGGAPSLLLWWDEGWQMHHFSAGAESPAPE